MRGLPIGSIARGSHLPRFLIHRSLQNNTRSNNTRSSVSENENRPVVTEIEQVRQALDKGKRKRLRKMLRKMHPAKVASLLESLDPTDRVAAWQQVDDEAEHAVLAHTSAELRDFILREAVEPEAETRTPARVSARCRRAG